MSNKALLYIVTSVTIMFIFQKLSDISIQFIKSSEEEIQQGMFMMPPSLMQPSKMQIQKPELWAKNEYIK